MVESKAIRWYREAAAQLAQALGWLTGGAVTVHVPTEEDVCLRCVWWRWGPSRAVRAVVRPTLAWLCAEAQVGVVVRHRGPCRRAGRATGLAPGAFSG